MNTFLTAQQELSGTEEITKVINRIKNIPLIDRIRQRGEREQRNGRLLTNYHPTAAKRVFKSRTMFKNRMTTAIYFYPII